MDSEDLDIRRTAFDSPNVTAFFDAIVTAQGLRCKCQEWNGNSDLSAMIYLAKHSAADPENMTFVSLQVMNMIISMAKIMKHAPSIKEKSEHWFKHDAIHAMLPHSYWQAIGKLLASYWQALFKAALRFVHTRPGLNEHVLVETHRSLSNAARRLTKMEIIPKEFTHFKHCTIDQTCLFGDIRFTVQIRRRVNRVDLAVLPEDGLAELAALTAIMADMARRPTADSEWAKAYTNWNRVNQVEDRATGDSQVSMSRIGQQVTAKYP